MVRKTAINKYLPSVTHSSYYKLLSGHSCNNLNVPVADGRAKCRVALGKVQSSYAGDLIINSCVAAKVLFYSSS